MIRIVCGLAAAAHVLYLSLLISCDLLRVAPRGFVPRFEDGRVTAANLDPDSVAARAGIRDGDRLVSANGQILLDHSDWQRMSVHVDPSRPLILVLERNGARFTVGLPLSSGVQAWRGATQMPGVMAFRAAQVGTLGFALLVAFKRTFQPSALLGALLLGSLATVSLSLPMRLAVFWHALPGWMQAPVWLPFTTSAAAGVLLFAFAAVFPRRIWSTTWIAVAVVPGALVVAWHLHWGIQLMRQPGPATGLGNAAPVVSLVNFAYAALAVALLVLQRRAAGTVTDQRRIGVLILGTAIGAAAAVGVIAGYWRDPGTGIFETRPMTLLALVFLAMPASFAYAILRHRLFDVRLIVRQGLRYALARRSVDALIPVLGALLLVDVVVHRQEPLASLVEARWWWYLFVGGALLLVRSRREQWLRRVDRRFFRDRYDAHRLLTSIAEQVGRAASFDAVAPAIVQQIDEALHPTFASVLRRVSTASSYSRGSGGISESGPVALPSSLTVIALLSVLRKPLALSLGETAWVRHQLPLEERALLLEHGIELLVPISGSGTGELPLGLLVLGPRRSDEPYNQEDLDLLTTIAHAVGAVLERSDDSEEGLAECTRCGRCYDSAAGVCANDGHTLSRTRGSLVINERYRLECRLGRGGMGVVYSATDTV
nr:PDZ domain-containing protein [Acidobacteriota bacterium]